MRFMVLFRCMGDDMEAAKRCEAGVAGPFALFPALKLLPLDDLQQRLAGSLVVCLAEPEDGLLAYLYVLV